MAHQELEVANNALYQRLRTERKAALPEIVAELIKVNEEELNCKVGSYCRTYGNSKKDELCGAAMVGIYQAARQIVEKNPRMSRSFTAYLKTCADNNIKKHLREVEQDRIVSARTACRAKTAPDRIAAKKGLHFKRGGLNTCWECAIQTRDYYPCENCVRAVRCKECHERWVRSKPPKRNSIVLTFTDFEHFNTEEGETSALDALLSNRFGDAGADRWRIVQTIKRECCQGGIERAAVQLAAEGQKRSTIARRLQVSRYKLDKILREVIQRVTEMESIYDQVLAWSEVAAKAAQLGPRRKRTQKVRTAKNLKNFRELTSEIPVMSL